MNHSKLSPGDLVITDDKNGGLGRGVSMYTEPHFEGEWLGDFLLGIYLFEVPNDNSGEDHWVWGASPSAFVIRTGDARCGWVTRGMLRGVK
jgi:hypothetical protein